MGYQVFLRIIRCIKLNGLKFRMWFKYGLKAQKLLAQGIALGMMAISKAPCKGKALCFAWSFKAFALTGRQVCAHKHPGRCPGLGASALYLSATRR